MLYPRTSHKIFKEICEIYLCSLLVICSNQLFDYLLVDKSNMVNDVSNNDDFVGLNPMSQCLAGTVDCEFIYVYIASH